MVTRSLPALLATALVACGGPTAPETGASAGGQQPSASGTPSQIASLPRTPAPAGATAYIIEPADGAVLSNPVRVVFGLRGIGVVPAGIERPDAGHHHLLIDTDLPPLGLPIPADERHVHFGAGQTETTLTLAPGRHRLQLLLGDHLHIPHDPPVMSEPITIEVQ